MKNRIERVIQEYRHARRAVADEEEVSSVARKKHVRAIKAQEILQSLAQLTQQQVHDQVAAVVTKCLAAVFQDPYEFRIVFERKRGKTEARMCFVRDGVELSPDDGVGIGNVDIASLALKIVCWRLSRPRRRGLMILDEPFKNVNGEGNRERAAELLEKLSEEFDIQFIITTGYDWLKIGKVVTLPG